MVRKIEGRPGRGSSGEPDSTKVKAVSVETSKSAKITGERNDLNKNIHRNYARRPR